MRNYFRLLSQHIKSKKLTSIIILVCLLIQIIVIVSFQIAYKEIFDGVAEKKIGVILSWIALILSATLIRISIGAISDYLIGRTVVDIFSEMRTELFHHLQWLPAGFYQKTRIGDLVSRYSHDLMEAENATRRVLPQIFINLGLGILSIGILFYFDWRLASFALVLFPFALLIGNIFLKKAHNATHINQQAHAKLSSMIEEVATQHLLLQAFNLHTHFLNKFITQLRTYKKGFIRGIVFRTLIGRTSIFGVSIVEILVFSVGAIMTYHGLMTIGTLFGFFALIWNVSAAITTLIVASPTLIEAGVGLERLQNLFNEKTEELISFRKTPHESVISGKKGNIVFRNVSLKHGENFILKNLDLEINEGESIAFVGLTGSGKTSILTLLMGFYPPSSGELFIGTQKIQDLTRDDLRTKMGIVFQHNPLFNLSLRENIRIGKLNASDEEIIEAAKKAEIHDFISSLPEGYDTLVREYGHNLSGGQKQRIAIARICLRNPSILLFDEPTSALDPIIEHHIEKTILRLIKGKTAIFSTHRFSLLKHFDRICVIEQGTIVESGKQDELIQKRGYFFALWEKQQKITLSSEGKKSKIDTSYLRQIELFKNLDDNLLKELSTQFMVEWLEEDKLVFEKGSYGDKFYMIAKGSCEVINPDAPLSLQRIAVLEEGDYFGEIALLKNVCRTATVATMTHCIFLTLHASQFEEILAKVPHLRSQLEKRMSQA